MVVRSLISVSSSVMLTTSSRRSRIAASSLVRNSLSERMRLFTSLSLSASARSRASCLCCARRMSGAA